MSEETKENVEKRYTDPVTGKFAEGNPGGGRPKGAGISITTEIKRKLEECPEGKDKTYLQYLIEKIMKKAVIDEDQQTIKQIWNYIDGMPKEAMDITSGGKPIVIPSEIIKQNDIDGIPKTDSE